MINGQSEMLNKQAQKITVAWQLNITTAKYK